MTTRTVETEDSLFDLVVRDCLECNLPSTNADVGFSPAVDLAKYAGKLERWKSSILCNFLPVNN